MSAKQAASDVSLPTAQDAPGCRAPAQSPEIRKGPRPAGRPPLSPEIYLEYRRPPVQRHRHRRAGQGRLPPDHKVGVQSCKIYIKPEDGAAYYVVNKVEGKLDL